MHESEVIRGNCRNTLFNRGRLTLCTAYLLSEEDFEPPPLTFHLVKINNCGTWGDVTAISITANMPLNRLIHQGAEDWICIITGREQMQPSSRCGRRICFVRPRRFWLSHYLSRATNAHVPGHDQTYSNACICPGLSCFSLVSILLWVTLSIV